ncbi:MAG: PAS domain S-box protein [Thermotogota bacterium]
MGKDIFNDFKMFNYINDAIYIHKLNTNSNMPGNFVFVNDAAIEKMGYSYEEFKRLTPADIDAPRNIDNIPDIIKSLKENQTQVFETRHITKSGEKIDIEISSKLIKIDKHSEEYILSIARDITKRKKLENDFYKFKKLADKSTSGVCFIDLDENIIYINEFMAKMHGYTPDELIGEKWRILHFESSYSKLDELIDDLYNSGYLESIKMPHKKKNGETVPVLSNVVYLKTELETLIGVTTTDLSSEEKIIKNLIEAKNKAVEANKAKEIFLANMNHELKTPLTGMIGTLSILKESECTEENKEFFNMLEKSANRLKELVDELLLSSEIKFGHIKKHFNWINLESVFEDLKDKYEQMASYKNIELKSSKENLNIEIKTDLIMIEEIIENILKNAFKFTEKGYVEFSMKLDKRILEIKVKDTGVGIKKEYIENLFDEFSQQDLSYTKEFEGFGLGLYITKKYINMLNGKISVNSVPKKGTEISVKIPVETKNKFEKSIDLSNKKVLITEDDIINLEIMKKYLSDEKIKIDTALDGEEALEKYSKQDFDIILMDIQLKKINGLEVIEKIRAIDNKIPILAISGFTRPEDRFKFILAGANDFLGKPYTKKELLDSIKKLINKE